jgi:hypothetical protein
VYTNDIRGVNRRPAAGRDLPARNNIALYGVGSEKFFLGRGSGLRTAR